MQFVAAVIGLVEGRGYRPGERLLSEREMAERFGVGRAVVREAMAMLEAMRYLERRRGSGVFLSERPDETSLEALVISSKVGLPLSNKINEDSIEVRRIIEVQAVRLACLRRSEEALERLQNVLDDFDRTVIDQVTASRYDFRFHMEIVRSTENELLIRLVYPFYVLARSRRAAFFVNDEQRRTSHAQHVQVFEAVKSRDPEMAASLMNMHIGRVDAWFKDRYAD
jgi:DNA-binding FadR family transcriptional regulator